MRAVGAEHALQHPETRLWMTARGYLLASGLPADQYTATQLGRVASQLCRQRQITPGKVADQRYGSVSSYPPGVLTDAIELINGRQ